MLTALVIVSVVLYGVIGYAFQSVATDRDDSGEWLVFCALWPIFVMIILAGLTYEGICALFRKLLKRSEK